MGKHQFAEMLAFLSTPMLLLLRMMAVVQPTDSVCGQGTAVDGE